jgi:hypothetical protein
MALHGQQPTLLPIVGQIDIEDQVRYKVAYGPINESEQVSDETSRGQQEYQIQFVW